MSFSDTPTFGNGQGCILSVFISALCTAVGFAILFYASGDGGIAAAAFTVALIGAMMIIGVSAVLLGLPLTQLLESNGWERPWSYPLAGFVLGGVIAYIAAGALNEAANLWPDRLFLLLIGALPGALCGGLWWWLERRHRRGGDRGEG
ncbi:MAG TPA: hypothetical protein VK472_02755 [Allosphingosinicella sp.]|nr:hypothetical protein [Allosphingosinicella sp.]